MFLGVKTRLWCRTQSLFWGNLTLLRSYELEMTINKATLVPHGKWWCLVAKTSTSIVISNVELLSGRWFMHDFGPLLSCGSVLHTVPWSSYKVSPNHTHKQDTITDMQCGCPLVWFMGDVVANVASVSFRGSGKLQIFPSQQEVQTWKK